MQAYHLVSLEKTRDIPQLDSLNGNWYRYVIANGISEITGYRCGSQLEVKEYVRQNIKRLNQKYDIKGNRQIFNKTFVKPCYFSDGLYS